MDLDAIYSFTEDEQYEIYTFAYRTSRMLIKYFVDEEMNR